MAQQVEIAGVLFNDVPYIQCPDGNGVYHQFLDTTIASNAAAAADIAQGKLAYVNGSLVTGTASGGGGGLEYETGTWTPASDIARGTISFAGSHSEPPIFFAVANMTQITLNASSNIACIFGNYYNAFGSPAYTASTNPQYGAARFVYGNTSSGSQSITALTGDANTSLSYWATSEAIYPYTNSTSRYWKSSCTYKWIAVWAPTS